MSNEFSLRDLILSCPKKLGWFRCLLCFDYFGVSRHTPKKCSVTDPRVWKYSPREQACWADKICVAHASDPVFLESMLFLDKYAILYDSVFPAGKELCRRQTEHLNTTSIGNCAYLATSKDVPCSHREQFRNIMKTFRHHMAPNENKDVEYSFEVDYFAWPEWLHPIHVCFGMPWFIVTRFDLICILLIPLFMLLLLLKLSCLNNKNGKQIELL